MAIAYLGPFRQRDDLTILLLKSFPNEDVIFHLLDRTNLAPRNDYSGPSKADMHIFLLDTIHLDSCSGLNTHIHTHMFLRS